MAVVSNASPIIVLSRIDRFSLLPDLFGEIHISDAVYREVVNVPADRPGRQALIEARERSVIVHATPDASELRPYGQFRSLSLADASVIDLAFALPADLALIDDLVLRNAAETQGLTVAGTGEVLVRAKRVGLIPNIRNPLSEAVREGLRLSKTVRDRLLERADELNAER